MDPVSDTDLANTIANTYGIAPRAKTLYDADKWQYEPRRWIKYANRADKSNCLILFDPDLII